MAKTIAQFVDDKTMSLLESETAFIVKVLFDIQPIFWVKL